MLSNTSPLAGNALASADLKRNQRLLTSTPSRTAGSAETANSFADNLRSIKTKIQADGMIPKTLGPSLPTPVKCDWPTPPTPTSNPERSAVPRCGLPEFASNNLISPKRQQK